MASNILYDIYISRPDEIDNRLIDEFKKTNWRICEQNAQQLIRLSNIMVCFLTRSYSLNQRCIDDVKFCNDIGKGVIYVLMEKLDVKQISINGKALKDEITIYFHENIQINVQYEQLFSITAFLIQQSNKYDGFISYRKIESFNLVSNTYERLGEKGLKLWLDRDQVGVGDDLEKKLKKGIKDSILFLSFISKTYPKAGNCKIEYLYACKKHKPPIFLVLEEGIPSDDDDDDLKRYMSDLIRLDVYKQVEEHSRFRFSLKPLKRTINYLNEINLNKLYKAIIKDKVSYNIKKSKKLKLESDPDIYRKKTRDLLKISGKVINEIDEKRENFKKPEDFKNRNNDLKNMDDRIEGHKNEIIELNENLSSEQDELEQYLYEKKENLDNERQKILTEQDYFIKKEKELTEDLKRLSEEQKALLLKQIDLREQASRNKTYEFTEREKNLIKERIKAKEEERKIETEKIEILSKKHEKIANEIDELEKIIQKNGLKASLQLHKGIENDNLKSKKQNKEQREMLLSKEDIFDVSRENIRIEDETDDTKLHLVAENNNIENIELILDRNYYDNPEDKNSQTTLHSGISKQEKYDIIRLLSEKQEEIPNKIDKLEKFIPLKGSKASSMPIEDIFEAARNGHKEIVEFHLGKKDVINSKDEKGQSPLHWAALRGHYGVVELLLEKKADINLKDQEGDTPLHLAALKGHKEIIVLLLKNKAHINSKDNKGLSPLYWAAIEGHREAFELLLKRRADIDSKDNNGQSLLHWAALTGQMEIFELLLEKNADIKSTDNNKQTPLHYAASEGHKEIVKLLLERRAVEINSKDDKRQSPLHLAASNGHIEVMELLLERNAEINPYGFKGQTPLHLAASRGQKDVVDFLLERKVDINSNDDKRQSPLHLAVLNGHREIVELLLERNANFKSKDINKQSPLHHAASQGYKDIVELLIERDANIRSRNNFKKTPLHLAASNGHKEVVKLLLERNADINSKDSNKQTPLHLAAKKAYKEIVELLLENSADIYLEDEEGNTPFNLAAQNDHNEVLQLLKRKILD